MLTRAIVSALLRTRCCVFEAWLFHGADGWWFVAVECELETGAGRAHGDVWWTSELEELASASIADGEEEQARCLQLQADQRGWHSDTGRRRWGCEEEKVLPQKGVGNVFSDCIRECCLWKIVNFRLVAVITILMQLIRFRLWIGIEYVMETMVHGTRFTFEVNFGKYFLLRAIWMFWDTTRLRTNRDRGH